MYAQLHDHSEKFSYPALALQAPRLRTGYAKPVSASLSSSGHRHRAPGGQTVDLRGAGRTVVERMGLLDQIRAMTVSQRGIAWVDSSGRHRAEMPVEAFGGRGIVSTDEILRGDLAAILYGRRPAWRQLSVR